MIFSRVSKSGTSMYLNKTNNSMYLRKKLCMGFMYICGLLLPGYTYIPIANHTLHILVCLNPCVCLVLMYIVYSQVAHMNDYTICASFVYFIAL